MKNVFPFLCLLLLMSGKLLAEKPAVLVMATKGFNASEFWGTYVGLTALGYRVVVAAESLDRIGQNREAPTLYRGVLPDLRIDQVQEEDYMGLFVPGGYSPGLLEKNPVALQLAARFLNNGAPTAAICHGPRLFMSAGLLKDRKVTTLYTVADELADQWAAREFGRYYDLPAILDRNLLTSRYPGDVPEFTYHFAKMLEARGGIAVKTNEAQVALILDSNFDDLEEEARRKAYHHNRSLFIGLGHCLGGRWEMGDVTHMEKALKDGKIKADDVDLWLVDVPEGAIQEGTAVHRALRAAAKAGDRLYVVQGGQQFDSGISYEDRSLEHLLPMLYEAALELRPSEREPFVLSEIPKPAEPILSAVYEAGKRYDAVLALTEGFDEQAAAEAVNALGAGTELLVLGPKSGKLRGVNGMEMEAAASYGDSILLNPSAIIVAPGFFWPRHNPKARQAIQPEWVIKQEEQHRIREEWLLRSHGQGARLLLVGQDALWIGRRADFKGKRFASTPQVRWSFGKKGGKFSSEPIHATTERMVTARGFMEVKRAIELLYQDAP